MAFVPILCPHPPHRERLLPSNRPALPCTARTAHRAFSSFLLDKGNGIGRLLYRAAPEDAEGLYTPSTNTARVEGRGIKGGEAPFAGGPGTRRFLAYLCLLSLREKVGRGAGRSARIDGCRAERPHWRSRSPRPCTHKPRPSPIYKAKKPFLRREPV